MRVADDHGGADVVELLQVGHDLREDLLAAQRAHVADVRRDDDALAPGERDRRLEVPAHREHGLAQRLRQVEFQRRDAAT